MKTLQGVAPGRQLVFYISLKLLIRRSKGCDIKGGSIYKVMPTVCFDIVYNCLTELTV